MDHDHEDKEIYLFMGSFWCQWVDLDSLLLEIQYRRFTLYIR